MLLLYKTNYDIIFWVYFGFIFYTETLSIFISNIINDEYIKHKLNQFTTTWFREKFNILIDYI